MNLDKKAENLEKALSDKFMVILQIAVVAVSIVSIPVLGQFLVQEPMLFLLCCTVLLSVLYVATLTVSVRRAPELGMKFATLVATNVCMPPAVFALLGFTYMLVDMEASGGGGMILLVAMIGSMLVTCVCAWVLAKIQQLEKSLSKYKEIKEILDSSEVSTETREELLRVALR